MGAFSDSIPGGDVAGRFAEWLGRALRLFVLGLVRLARTLPGLAAPALVVYGVALVYVPAAWVVAGLMLFLVDRRVGSDNEPEKERE